MFSSKAYNPKESEAKIYSFWEKSGFFNPDLLPSRYQKQDVQKFSAMMAPLNITGEAHIGHALENTLLDIFIRRERMLGKKVLWVPGIDHAGIATQNVVEKQLKKEGLNRFEFGREKFTEKIWQWKEKYGGIILDQLKKLGLSCDWSRTRFTMDSAYSKAVMEAFVHYHQKGWIYRGQKVVNWCPRCQTSLSDLELENKEETGRLWYIRYPLKASETQNTDPEYIVAATTRPETMLGDTAVAVNPKDKRYKNLIGKTAILPLLGREIPIIADDHIDPEFGTGALKVTPGHDITDWEIGIKNKLPVINLIDERGKMTPESKICSGLKPLECREKVVEMLEKEGFLEKVEDYKYVRPYCYRCHSLIEPILSEQWFLKMKELAQMAKDVVKKGTVKFVPKNFEKIYFDWLENIQDWCISRQIWWGHNLPIWKCQTGKMSNVKSLPRTVSPLAGLVRGQISKADIKKHYFVSLEKPEKCPLCGKCQPKQVDDVLDTWFSSALWPFAALGWPGKTKDFEEFYPTNIISSDRGIINLWQARMIFSALEFTGKAPFPKIYIHATVMTKEGKRMSKSLGTGIDPLVLVEKYGADAARFGIIWQTTGVQDIRFDEGSLLMGKKFCNKIWNAARFVETQISNEKFQIKNACLPIRQAKLQFKSRNLSAPDSKIIAALNNTVSSVNQDLDNFRFGQAAETIYHFFWHEFCDKYLEISKEQLKIEEQKSQTMEILIFVLLNSMKILHPFMPFITEEIYQGLPLKNKEKSLMVETWPETI